MHKEFMEILIEGNPFLYKTCPSEARLVLTVSPSKISVPMLKSAIFTYLG